MQVHFWGSRGSLPASISAAAVRSKIVTAIEAAQGRSFGSADAIGEFIDRNLPFAVRGAYGGNTSCVEICNAEEYILCDAGTGLRDFGVSLAPFKTPGTFHIFMSHLHWDHIQGFPFFTPAYIPGNRIHIYGGHPDLEQAFVDQQRPPFFPVPFKAMQADIRFTTVNPEQSYEIAGVTVRSLLQNHPGESFGYSFSLGDKKIVYSTDSEHKREAQSPFYPFLDFIDGADLLIFDAQYTLVDAIGVKENWGHSNNIVGVELAVEGKVKRLCLFHNEHTCDDNDFDQFLADTRAYLAIHAPTNPLEIDLAYDGLEIRI
ncbi:MAG: MBL fold metallo-hydrolase [Syntrophales bacterium]|nr:MBL fold metallo-hydrolase [Syntrophales bacterium]